MKEYIERTAALDICQKEYEDRLRMADYCGDTVAWNIGGAIKGIPAADVAPVRHGRWTDPEDDGGYTSWYCSLCNHPVGTIGGYPNWKYCPNCGARMDKEDEHEVS